MRAPQLMGRAGVVSPSLSRTSLLHDGDLPSGEHTLTWDGRTDGLERAAPGVYLITLGTSSGLRTQRVVVTH